MQIFFPTKAFKVKTFRICTFKSERTIGENNSFSCVTVTLKRTSQVIRDKIILVDIFKLIKRISVLKQARKKINFTCTHIFRLTFLFFSEQTSVQTKIKFRLKRKKRRKPATNTYKEGRKYVYRVFYGRLKSDGQEQQLSFNIGLDSSTIHTVIASS